MNKPRNDLRIDYIEFPCRDVAAAKLFYGEVFGWEFTDYGPRYVSFEDGRMRGGFNAEAPVAEGGALVVVYASDIHETLQRVMAHGGTITKQIFEFAGGRRFHFADSSGNELAVWSE